MRQPLQTLRGEALVRAAQRRAAYDQPWLTWIHYRAKEYLMIAANVAMNFYCADAFTRKHLPDQAVLNDVRLGVLILLGVGTFVGNYFSKLPVLAAPVNGLKLTDKQKRMYRAIEIGLVKSRLLTARHPERHHRIRAVLTHEDYLALGERGRALTHQLLQASYDVEFDIVSQEGAAERVSSSIEAGSSRSGEDAAIDICVDHDDSAAAVTFKESAHSKMQTFKHGPLAVGYYSSKWLLIRLGMSLSVIFSINHSIHNVAQTWLGFSEQAKKPVLWAMLALGLGVGFYRSLTYNSLINHKCYQEIALMDARRQLGLRPQLNAKAMAMAIVPQIISFFFNSSIAIFFGKDGLVSLFEQVGWAVRGEAYEPPNWLSNAFVAWFLVAGLLTAATSSMIETYRKAESHVVGEGNGAVVVKRKNDNSTQQYKALWALALFGVIADSVNYGLVGASSAEQAWSVMGPKGALALALTVLAGITVVSTFWSYSTLRPRFAGTVEAMCACSRTKPTSKQQPLLMEHKPLARVVVDAEAGGAARTPR